MSVEKSFNERLKLKSYFIFFIIICLFLVIVSRLFYIQVYNRSAYVDYSKKQFIRTTKVFPNRGQVFDRNGSPLALNVQRFNVFVMPQGIKDLGTLSYEISKIIKGTNYKKLYRKIKSRKKFTWVKRNAEFSEKEVAKLKKIPGVHIEPVWTRFYPNQSLASQVIGFVNIDNKGISGIEYLFNEDLTGSVKLISYVRDAKGRALKFESETSAKDPIDFTLSIDKEIQRISEKFLREGVLKHNAKSGGVGVMDAKTGEIWAMANYPSFNPNNPQKSLVSNRKLSFISVPFEAGSVLKTHTVALGLANSINENRIFNCENGKFKIGSYTVKESANHKYKLLSVDDILALSSNIGTTKIAFELGQEKIKKGFSEFGFGRKTLIEFPGESRGIFNIEKKLKKIELSNNSFGQGIATTGIQILRAYSPFANEGKMVQPTFIKKSMFEVDSSKQVLKKDIVKRMNKILLKVVDEGTGKNAQIKNFRIAGKTGTAQKPSRDGKGYEKDAYVASFAGYPLGVEKPFVVFVYVDRPTENGYYGNEAAAPIFKKIVESILIKNNELRSTSENLLSENEKIEASEKVKERVQKLRFPNFIGLDTNSAKDLAKKTGFRLKIKGKGIIKEQYPKAFSNVKKDRFVKVILKVPQYE